MSTIKKPDPVAWIIYEPITKRHILSEVELETKYLDDGTIAYSVSPVVFQSQSEVYANALAAEREQKTVDSIIDVIGDCHIDNHQLTEITERIRALIPKQ